MFTVQADLSEQQRERLTSHMTIRGIHVQNYTFEALREAFIELFCAPKSGLDNPNYRTTGQGRSFLSTHMVNVTANTDIGSKTRQHKKKVLSQNSTTCSGHLMIKVRLG